MLLFSHHAKTVVPFFKENFSLCSVQSEEGVAPQGVHRAEAATALWASAVLLLRQHRRGILNQGFVPRTIQLDAETEGENELSAASECETLHETHTLHNAPGKEPEQRRVDQHILRTF